MKKILFMGLLPLLAMAGCAASRPAPVADPQFAAHAIRTVLLPPVVFADAPIDRRHGGLAAEDIRRQAAQALEAKGYRVHLAGESFDVTGPPMVAAGSDLAGRAPPVPPGSDAVVQIRVDHFLDAALYDERSRGPLDIYATAVMTGSAGETLWQGTGRGEGVRQALFLRTDDFFPATSRLIGSLFATLPPAP